MSVADSFGGCSNGFVQILRQQLALAELVRSCFNPTLLSPIPKVSASRKRKREASIPATTTVIQSGGLEVEVSCVEKGSSHQILLVFVAPRSMDGAKKQKTTDGATEAPPSELKPGATVSATIDVALGGTPTVHSVATTRVNDTLLSALLEVSLSVPLSLMHAAPRLFH